MGIIEQFIQLFKVSKGQVVYIRGDYCIRCQEVSRDTRDSYFYQYNKPCLIVTADNRIILADEIFKSRENNLTLVNGLKGELHDSYSGVGIRDREYILYISKKACPLKIKYSSGSGEGYKDSDYWSSESKEYWISYLSDNENS